MTDEQPGPDQSVRVESAPAATADGATAGDAEGTAAVAAEGTAAGDALSGLADTGAQIDWPDSDAERDTRDRLAVLDVPVGALGRLEDLAVWIAGVQGVSPPRPLRRPRVVLVAGDHGIAAAGVSVRAAGATSRDVERVLAGGGPTGLLATITDVGVQVADLAVDADTVATGAQDRRVRRGSARIDAEDALTEDEERAAVAAGIALADAEIDAGADLLIAADLGRGSTTAAAVLVSVITGTEPVKVVGRGSGLDDEGWMRKVAVIRDARHRGLPHRAEPDRLLAAVGGADLAALAGFLTRAAARRTPVLLDGLVVSAAALLVRETAPRAIRWWRAAHRTTEPAHALTLDRLRLEPILDLSLGLGGGAGALLAVPVLQAAVALAGGLDIDPDKQRAQQAARASDVATESIWSAPDAEDVAEADTDETPADLEAIASPAAATDTAVPDGPASNEVAAGQTAPGAPGPDQTGPDGAGPDGAVPREAGPHETVPRETVPREAVPDDSVLDGAAHGAPAPGEGQPDAARGGIEPDRIAAEGSGARFDTEAATAGESRDDEHPTEQLGNEKSPEPAGPAENAPAAVPRDETPPDETVPDKPSSSPVAMTPAARPGRRPADPQPRRQPTRRVAGRRVSRRHGNGAAGGDTH